MVFKNRDTILQTFRMTIRLPWKWVQQKYAAWALQHSSDSEVCPSSDLLDTDTLLFLGLCLQMETVCSVDHPAHPLFGGLASLQACLQVWPYSPTYNKSLSHFSEV